MNKSTAFCRTNLSFIVCFVLFFGLVCWQVGMVVVRTLGEQNEFIVMTHYQYRFFAYLTSIFYYFYSFIIQQMPVNLQPILKHQWDLNCVKLTVSPSPFPCLSLLSAMRGNQSFELLFKLCDKRKLKQCKNFAFTVYYITYQLMRSPKNPVPYCIG